MRKILIALGAVFFSLAAQAQVYNPGVTQSGAVTANHCVVWNGLNSVKDGGAACSALAPVQSVFGRTGAVVATLGDYSFSLISGNWTYAQGPTVTASRLLGNPSGAGASMSEISLGSGLQFSAGALANSGVLSFNSRAGAVVPANGDYSVGNLSAVAANSYLGNPTIGAAAPTATAIPACASDGGHAITYTSGTGFVCTVIPAGGTVTSFSAGALSPLFTTNVATATTTPALSFTLSTAAANTALMGPTSGAAAAPTYRAITAADLPSGTVVGRVVATTGTVATDTTGNMPGAANTAPTTAMGSQYASITYTPKSATNNCTIKIWANVATSVAAALQIAGFQTGVSTTAIITAETNTSVTGVVTLLFSETSVTCGAMTGATARYGLDRAGTATLNGSAGVQIGGGVLKSGIEVTESIP